MPLQPTPHTQPATALFVSPAAIQRAVQRPILAARPDSRRALSGASLEPKAHGHVARDVARFAHWRTTPPGRTHSQEGAHPCART